MQCTCCVSPVQLLRPTSSQWAAYLTSIRHDFYFSPAYHDFAETQGHGEAWLAVVGSADKFLAWPFLARRLPPVSPPDPDELRDLTSVYGYAGPLVFGCTNADPFLPAAWKTLLGYWRASGVVNVFCRFHPLLENHLWVQRVQAVGGSEALPDLNLKFEGYTVSLDLSRTDEEAWTEYRETHRRHIKRARRYGLICEVDHKFMYLSDFRRLYDKTMRRNVAASQYFFPADYFGELRRKLDSAIFLHVARSGTRLAAAALVSEYQGIVQYLFGGVDDEFLEISPLKLLLESVRKWARSRNDLVLHLGGGRGGHEDSLFYFKSGFSSRRHPFYTGRCILNPGMYHGLAEEHFRQAGKIGKAVDPDFFPAYRAPLAERSEDPHLATTAALDCE